MHFVHICVPEDEARRLPVLAHPPRGQTPGSRWVGESGRYLQRSGKPQGEKTKNRH